jgi:hypothetical protein
MVSLIPSFITYPIQQVSPHVIGKTHCVLSTRLESISASWLRYLERSTPINDCSRSIHVLLRRRFSELTLRNAAVCKFAASHSRQSSLDPLLQNLFTVALEISRFIRDSIIFTFRPTAKFKVNRISWEMLCPAAGYWMMKICLVCPAAGFALMIFLCFTG